jgi:alginate O-acetyltransferase complex protein AlgJ
VPVPSKATIYPDRLAPGYDIAAGPNLNPDHAAWRAALRAKGVDVLDLTDAFWAERNGAEGPVFHRTDSHWTQRGMRLAARAIAQHLRPMTPDLPRAEPFGTRTFRHAFVGDLRKTTGTGTDADAPDVVEDCRQLYRQDGPVVPGHEAPVLVIGDSFGALLVEHGCGLSQQLMAETGVAVQSAALVGGHSGGMRRRLNDPGILENRRVVVFAFAIRQIPLGGDWVPVKLAP